MNPIAPLWLVPTPLDFGADTPDPIESHLPLGTLQQAARITHWVAENAKSLRAFLKRVDAVAPLAAPLQSIHIETLPHGLHKHGDHRSDFDARPLLQAALAGQSMGLASEAGLPAVADPGSSVVRAAHRLGISVRPLSGPSSLLLALAASGLDGQSFAFVGYVPQDRDQRQQDIRQLEQRALRQRQTQILIETPYRNRALWESLCAHLSPATQLAHASGLLSPNSQAICRSVADWRRLGGGPGDQPTIFLFGA